MADASWLSRFIDPVARVPANGLWRLDGYVIATDRKGFLALRGDERSAQDMTGLNAEVSRAMLATDSDAAVATTLGDLWAWLDHLCRIPCPECLGRKTGAVDPGPGSLPIPGAAPRFRCFECDGDGWTWPEPETPDDRTVVVAEKCVDANLLAWWLAPELGDSSSPVRVWSATVGVGKPTTLVIVAGAGWRVVVAGLAESDERAARRFRTYAPGAGLWYESRRQFPPESHPGTDWFIEQGFDACDLVKMWGEPEPAAT